MLISFKLTPGNVDDRNPVDYLIQGREGKLIGDKGYIFQQLFNQLYQRGLQLVSLEINHFILEAK